MSQYIVSARKYRPSTFRSVVGQRSLTTTLKNAIDSSRLAQAYLFCGPRGVGKTSCARIFAKTINCLNPTADGEACNECESCRAFNEGRSYNIVELDAASNNSVDDIRSLTEQVRIPPQTGKWRVFIIDEVHMLSVAAFNAFLKTLEEPPAYVIFILATTEKHKVIPTILSRCQIYDFNRITIDDMVDHLEYVAGQEGITVERDALNVIAQKADGAMRDALSIFDQVAASSMGNITYSQTIENLNVLDYEYYLKLTEAFRNADVQSALLVYKDIRDRGFDSHFFITGLGNHLRQLMVAADSRTLPLLEVGKDVAERFMSHSRMFNAGWYYRAMEICNECDLNYRFATNKQFLIELSLIKLCNLCTPSDKPDSKPTVDKVDDISIPHKDNKGVASPAGVTTNKEKPASQSVAVSVQKPSVSHNVSRPASSLRPQHGAAHSAPVSAPPRLGGGTVSNAVQKKEEHVQVAVGNRNEPFDAPTLHFWWKKYADDNPSMHILVSAMRAAQPEQIDACTYKVKVWNPAQEQMMESSMPKLLSYLRDSLKNDFLSLRVELVPEGERIKVLTPKEFLDNLVSSNPVVSDVLRDFDAELA